VTASSGQRPAIPGHPPVSWPAGTA
jgi:hypothetical protein